jgi:hypothetical protein
LPNQLVPKVYVDTSVAAKTNTVTTYNPTAIYNTTTYTYYGKVFVQKRGVYRGQRIYHSFGQNQCDIACRHQFGPDQHYGDFQQSAQSRPIVHIWRRGNCVRQGKWVAMGNGTNAMAYSYDGINWVNIPTTVFAATSGVGSGLAFNGRLWVAGGGGAINTLAYPQ